MENRFRNASDEELKVYCQQYREWQKTSVILDNELGKMRDYYSSWSNTWQINLIADLLDVLMERWMGKEKNVMMIDGITTCCGYDFGTYMSNKKIKYCPICGKKIESVKK